MVGQAQDAGSAVELSDRSCPGTPLCSTSRCRKVVGIAALRQVMTRPNPPRVAMLTASEEDDDVMQALMWGAAGLPYILKGVGSRESVLLGERHRAGRSVRFAKSGSPVF